MEIDLKKKSNSCSRPRCETWNNVPRMTYGPCPYSSSLPLSGPWVLVAKGGKALMRYSAASSGRSRSDSLNWRQKSTQNESSNFHRDKEGGERKEKHRHMECLNHSFVIFEVLVPPYFGLIENRVYLLHFSTKNGGMPPGRSVD